MRKSKKREYNAIKRTTFFVLLPLLALATTKSTTLSKEPSKQVRIKGDFSMFGSRAYHDDDAFLDAKKRAERENRRMREMRESVGDEAFEMIQQSLSERSGQPMRTEEIRVSTRDGGKEPDTIYVRSFLIDRTAVSVRQFRNFVKESKYKTDAEKFKWSFVLKRHLSSTVLEESDGPEGLGHAQETPWWIAVLGAYWRRPEGSDSSIKNRNDEPVTHISWNDAKAYCEFYGRRLPTEMEWEAAARGGLEDALLPWGDELNERMCNGWQGAFPDVNSNLDGFDGVSPVNAFEPNGFGLYNMVGNVWEWTDGGKKDARPMRGGSFVDTLSGEYNHALRVSTRMTNTPDSSASNTGFHCASDYVRQDL
jgi:formylglycine-generating enzyme required for sulfatase activity